MKYFVLLIVVWVALITLPTSPSSAQNVSSYESFPDPFLFLLREAAVRDELGLTEEQDRRLVELNESFDGVLLSTRNGPRENGRKAVSRVNLESRQKIASLLSLKQQTRLRQISSSVRGGSFVLARETVARLELTETQEQTIDRVVERAAEAVRGLQNPTYQTAVARRQTQLAVAAARRKERREILDVLDDKQSQILQSLLGKPFDASRLGRVTFKAPELSTGDEWINSDELQLPALRGKVVALHFFAFG